MVVKMSMLGKVSRLKCLDIFISIGYFKEYILS